MALSRFYPPLAPSENILNIVVVPGIGLVPLSEWRDSSGQWLKELPRHYGGQVCVWRYEWAAIDGQSIRDSLVQQSHKLPLQLQRLNATNSAGRPILIVCQSLGGYIWKQAFANMVAKSYEYKETLNDITGVVFLGTPHVEEEKQLDSNIIETITRACSKAPFSFLSFTREDNRETARISRDFSSFDGNIISTFETVESKVRHKRLKIQFSRSLTVITEELAKSPSHPGAKLVGISKSHEDVCKVDLNGELYNAIARVTDAAIVSHKLRVSHLGHSDRNSEGSVADIWDLQSLRSHSSRMETPVKLMLSENASAARLDQGIGNRSLSASSAELKPQSKTPSASAGYSSQSSYEMVPAVNHMEMDKPKLHLPCFSVGSKTRKAPFFGRDDILRSIDRSLLPANASSPTNIDPDHMYSSGNLKTFALCGAGGIGKTETASEYAFTRSDKFSAILWVTADNRNVLLGNFARVARDLGLQDESGSQDLIEAGELVKGWLCNPVKNFDAPLSPDNEATWLLVFDNVDDWGIIEDFWPTTGIGSILITSRNPISKSHVYTAKHGLDLEPLSTSESIEFLNFVSAKHFKGDSKAARAVADRSGGLPLLMTAIAGTMLNEHLTYNGMIDLLTSRGLEAISVISQEHGESIPKARIASMIGLAGLDGHTRSLIYVLSFLHPEEIPARMLMESADQQHLAAYPRNNTDLNSARSKLEQASLITFNASTQAIRMHRIIQDIVRESIHYEIRSQVIFTALDRISAAWIYQPLESRFNTARYEACSKIFPHVDQIFQHYEEMFMSRKIQAHERAAALFNDAGWYWFERGLPQESKPFFKLAQSICHDIQRTNPSERVSDILRESHNNQGSAANETNDKEQSLQHNLMWLELMGQRTSTDGGDVVDYELGCVYSEVGVAYAMNGMHTRAIEYFEKSISTYRSLPDYNETWLGWPLPNIGLVHWVQGNFKAALEALHQMREIYKAAYGPDDTDSFKTGKVLYGIGNVYLSIGDLDQALDYHLRCMNQWLATLGPKHHRIGDVSHKLAQDLMGQGDFEKAHKWLSQALELFGRRPYYKQEYARTVFRQGQLYFASGEIDLAEQSFKAAQKLRQKLVRHDARQWDELIERDYDDLVIFWSR